MQVCDSLAGSRGTAPLLLLLLPNFFFLKDWPPPTRSVSPPLSEANALKDLDCPPSPHSYWPRRSPGLRERSLKSPQAWDGRRPWRKVRKGITFENSVERELFFSKIQESKQSEVVYRDLEILPPSHKGSIK